MPQYVPPPPEEFSDSCSDDEIRYLSQPPQAAGVNKSDGLSDFRSPHGANRKPMIRTAENSGVDMEDFRLSVVRGNLESAQRIIKQGVDVNMKFKTGWTALMYAAHQLNLSLITLLLENGANPNAGTPTPLMACCTSNATNKPEEIEKSVLKLIEHGAEVDSFDQYGLTPLMMACKKGHVGAARVLLENKADVNRKENRGYTSLSWAASGGYLPCIKLLAENGADLNVKTSDGFSVLKLAERSGCYGEIHAYLSSQPSFIKDESAGGDWMPLVSNGLEQSANRSIGFNSGFTNFSSKASVEEKVAPVKTDNYSLTEDKVVETTTNMFCDVDLFLCGLELSSLVSLFQQHNIAMSHLLNITDDELIKIGVISVGHRKKILESVHELNKKEWQDSSIPAIEKVRASKQLSCAEVTAMIASIASHSACMNSSLLYIQSQITFNPKLLQVDKNGRGVHALRRFLHELKENSNTQAAICSQLRDIIEKLLISGSADAVDHITKDNTERSTNRLVTYSKAALVLGVISCCMYAVFKKFAS